MIQPLLGIDYNYSNNNFIYNTFYDDMRMFLTNNIKEQNNFAMNNIKKIIIKTVENSDNIGFTDYLLYQNMNLSFGLIYLILAIQ